MRGELRALVDERRFHEALNELEAELALHPYDPEVHYLTAFCLQQLDNELNLTRALCHFNRALEIGYDEVLTRYGRGSLHLRAGDLHAARADLEAVIEREPGHQGARQLLELVEQYSRLDPEEPLGELPGPVLVCSVPKCGTHLLKNILAAILGPPNVVPGPWYRRLVSAEQILAAPELENKVYVGHIAHSDALARRTANLPKIILIRDPRDYVLSQAHFYDGLKIVESGLERQFQGLGQWTDKLSAAIFGLTSSDGTALPSVYNMFTLHAMNWMQTEPLVVRFEDLVGARLGGDNARVLRTVRSILDTIGVRVDDEHALAERIEAGSNPGRSPTFRSGKSRTWRDELTPRHIEQMKAAAPGLVPALGYEPDESWNLENTSDTFGTVDPSRAKDPADTLADTYGPLLASARRNRELRRIIKGWAAEILIGGGRPAEVLPVLDELLRDDPNHARWNYLKALCLHDVARREMEDALQHYHVALQQGFSEFWVRYNRGMLLLIMGSLQSARADIERALELDPTHEDARRVLRRIRERLEGR